MKLDTDKEGLEAIFKTWAVPLIDEFLTGRSMTSGQAHKFLEKKGIKTGHKGRGIVSRTSVIFFLNDMIDAGLLEYTMGTGKGGYHRCYKMTLTLEELAHKLIDQFVNKLLEVFPEESKTFMWPKRR